MSEPDWGYLWRLETGRVKPTTAVCVCGKPIYHASDWWNHDADGSIQHDDGTYARPEPDTR